MFTTSWTVSESAFDADSERADASVVEATLLWGDSTLAVRHVGPGEVITVGSDDGCDMHVGGEGIDAVRIEHGTSGVHVLPGTTASVMFDGWPRDRAPFDLGIGHRAEMMLGAFTLRLRVVAAGKAAALSWADRVKQMAFGGVGTSFALHISVVAALAFFMPALGADDSEQIDKDRLYAMKALLDASAAKEMERMQSLGEESPAATSSDSGGARAQGAEGQMGTPLTKATGGHYAAKGDKTPHEATLSRAEQIKEVENSEMLALVGALATRTAGSNAPAVPWDSMLNGLDDRNLRGDLFSDSLGEAFGSGLGFSGNEEGGGGKWNGIGMNDIGGISASMSARIGNGKCMVPPCDGMGNSTGRLMKPHTPKGPQLRVAKTEIEGGRLAPEVIQRIVRMSHGRFRNCYEAGLRTNPSLGGRVAVRFVIARDGSVSLANDAGSDLPDETVKKCVVQTFYSLSFPAPENGTVRVTYPISLSPSE